MIKVVSADRMRAADAGAISAGTPSITLMRRAAEAIYDAYPEREGAAIVSGPGNNGGDGFALAEVMLEKGLHPCVFHMVGKLSPDAEYYYNRIKGRLVIEQFSEKTSLKGFKTVYDCIFGTGMKRQVEGGYAQAIEVINASGAFVVSADIPSGLSSDSGRVLGNAVKADITVAIGEYKTGHFLNDGKDYCGRVIRADIGIPVEDGYYCLYGDEEAAKLFPKRKRNINKGSSGRLAIIAGSTRYMGAALLASMGASALLTGAGLVTLAVPASYIAVMMERITSCTLFPMPDMGGSMIYSESAINDAVKGCTAIAAGMGMGSGEDVIKIVKDLIGRDIKLILDADALNALSRDPEILNQHKADILITPHPGELARLLNKSVSDVLDDPIGLAKAYAVKCRLKVLLKGVTTVVTDGAEVWLIDRGAPSMAKGGSGDVLAGVIAGLTARTGCLMDSACGGAYLAGFAGEIAAEKINEYSALPEDTAKYIQTAINRLLK